MFIWVLANKNYYQLQVNLLIGESNKIGNTCITYKEHVSKRELLFSGLILDILVVAVLKAITRRRRPSINNDIFSIGPDKYSFPSGHASRAAFVVYTFIYLWPVALICVPPLLAWSFSICVSRILMRRHYILDVLAGIVIGIFEGLLTGYMYLDHETCVNLISWITDEKMSGAEYDV